MAGASGERHPGPALAWVAAFIICGVGDALLGRWVLTPVFVAAFYAGMIVIDLVTYPVLTFWRGWLRRRGPRAWYLVEVAGLWGGTTLLVFVLVAPWWLSWRWGGALPLQALGGFLLAGSVAVGAWACFKMGWARLLFAGALFPPGTVDEARVPQRLVVEGPYRYVRNPLYDTDFLLILGTALLARSWSLVLLVALYLAQLGLQLPLEERELRKRFGRRYRRYCQLVPRFVPRRKPVTQRELDS